MTPLILASGCGHVEIVRELLVKADKTVRSRYITDDYLCQKSSIILLFCSSGGFTALKYAIKWARADVVALLKSVGAPE
jgi:hypothetical protein